ncbi:MAG: TRAP transporter substrate-binding protein DctP, partial [Eubacteriales bacterium]
GKIKVESPADLKGVKFRVPGAQVFIKTFQALGANTITTPSSDVYNAIQTGLADGCESSIPDLAKMQMQEVISSISLTGHFIGTSSAVMSNEVFNKLSPEQQEIMVEEFKNAAEVCSEEYATQEVEARKVFEDAGVEFIEVDKTPFKEMTKVIYSQETFPNMSPGIYDKLQVELAKIRAK